MSKDRRRKGTEKRTCTGFREEGDEKATLHLAWKICKVLIAFYNYLGAGRLSYPIHSRTTLAYHPLLCFLAPSAFLSWGFFFLVFSLSFSHFPLFLCRTPILSLSQFRRYLRRTLARSPFPSPPNWHGYVCVSHPYVGCRARSHVFTLERARR